MNIPYSLTTMKSIQEIVREYQHLLSYRARLFAFCGRLTSEKFNIVIGGSYALKYYIPNFDREVGDYDFIVKGNAKAIEDIKTVLNMLRSLYAIDGHGSSSESIGLARLMGKKVDILFKVTDDLSARQEGRIFETEENILKVKKEYCDKRAKTGLPIRQKDLADIAIIETDLAGLPF